MSEEEKKEVPVEDKKDLDLMEIEVFRQFWRSLNLALGEIKELRGSDVIEVDNAEIMRHEISTLKKELSELKELLVEMQKQNTASNQQQQVQQVQQPQIQQQRIPVMQPIASPLPYYPTPNYAPVVPIIQ
jgi:transcription initiation factor TFIID subunit TAF12